MTVRVRIAENRSQKNWLFEKTFDATSAEWAVFQQALVVKKSFSAPYLVVTRTDTWAHLSQDLFLPSLSESAFKTKTLAQKIFAILRDLVTFLPRLFSLINTPKKEQHPLHQYLQNQNADQSILNRDCVFIETTSYSLDSTNLSEEEREFVLQTMSSNTRVEESFPYIELPKYAIDNQKEFFTLDLAEAPKIDLNSI